MAICRELVVSYSTVKNPILQGILQPQLKQKVLIRSAPRRQAKCIWDSWQRPPNSQKRCAETACRSLNGRTPSQLTSNELYWITSRKELKLSQWQPYRLAWTAWICEWSTRPLSVDKVPQYKHVWCRSSFEGINLPEKYYMSGTCSIYI